MQKIMTSRTSSGFTLIEIMVACSLLLIAALAVGYVIQHSMKQKYHVQNQQLTNMTLGEVNDMATSEMALTTSGLKAGPNGDTLGGPNLQLGTARNNNHILFNCLDAGGPDTECESKVEHEFTLYTPHVSVSGAPIIPAPVAGLDPEDSMQYIRYSRNGNICKSTQPHDQCPVIAKAFFMPICLTRQRTCVGSVCTCKNTESFIVRTEFSRNHDTPQEILQAVEPEIRSMFSMGAKTELNVSLIAAAPTSTPTPPADPGRQGTSCVSWNDVGQCSGINEEENGYRSPRGGYPAISFDGRYVVFCAQARFIETGNTSTARRVYITDTWSTDRRARLVSIPDQQITLPTSGFVDRGSCALPDLGTLDPSPELDDYDMSRPSISADGRFVAFTSRSKLAGNGTDNHRDVYVRDTRPEPPTAPPKTELVSVDPSLRAHAAEISPDGRYVAYLSLDELEGDSDGNTTLMRSTIRVRDRTTARTSIVSLKSNGDQVSNVHQRPAISANGRFVVFSSNDRDVVENAQLNEWTGAALYVRDTSGGLSVSSDGGGSFFQNITSSTPNFGSSDVRAVFVLGSMVYAATNNGLSISSDNGENFVRKTTANGLGSNNVRGVYAQGTMVYAATAPINGTGGGLSISNDGGSNFFRNVTAGANFGSNDVRGVFASADGLHIYAATSGGLSISNDRGFNFINRTTDWGLGSNDVRGVSVQDARVYAATAGGLSILTDHGATFSQNIIQSATFGSNNVRGVYAQGPMVYVATAPLNGAGGGLSISSDSGGSFVKKTTVDGLESNDVRGVFVSADGANIYAATAGGLSISNNSGGLFTNRALTNGNVWGVAVNGARVYAAQMGITELINWNVHGTQAGRRLLLDNITQCTGIGCRGDSGRPSISPDGRYVTFESNNTDLVTAASLDSSISTFLRDRQDRTTICVSVANDPETAANPRGGVQASLAAGSSAERGAWLRVVFNSNPLSHTFQITDISEPHNIFLRVLSPAPARTSLVSVNSNNQAGRDPHFPTTEADAFKPFIWNGIISGDGRYVVFDSMAGNFDTADTNDMMDVFIRQLSP